MKYLGIKPDRPKIAVFDFTSCEGCELQLANKEETLVDFLGAVEVMNFREVSSAASDDYAIAFVEGAISRLDEVKRLEKIRKQAAVLVAFGSCACFGGVARMKNAYDLDEANREVYGDKPKETALVRAIAEVVQVDLMVPGCPVNKAEVEKIVRHVAFGVPFEYPLYPICMECKQKNTTCMFEKGALCLGPITRAGCNAPCPAGGLGCWGCRGPAHEPNYQEFFTIAEKRGIDKRELSERLNFFGGFSGVQAP